MNEKNNELESKNEFEIERLKNMLNDKDKVIDQQSQQLNTLKSKFHSVELELKDEISNHKQTKHQLSLSKSVNQSIKDQTNRDLKRNNNSNSSSKVKPVSVNVTTADEDDIMNKALMQSHQNQFKLNNENGQWREIINEVGNKLNELAQSSSNKVETLTGNNILDDYNVNINNFNKPFHSTLKNSKEKLNFYLKVIDKGVKMLSGQKTVTFVDDYDFDKVDILKEELENLKKELFDILDIKHSNIGNKEAESGRKLNVNDTINELEESENFKPRRSNRLNLSELTTNNDVEHNVNERPRKIPKVTGTNSNVRRPSAAAGAGKLAATRMRN